MTEFLVAQGNRRQDVGRTAAALYARVTIKGFKCRVRLSDHVVKTTASRFGDDKKSAFIQKKLTGKLSKDFFGISESSEAKFAAAGIANTDQLFAAFLSILDDEQPAKNSAKCDEFYRMLDDLGAAAGFKSVIIYQLQAKLGVGIDAHGPAALNAALPTLAEEEGDESEEQLDPSDRTGGGNVQASRRGTSKIGTGAASTSRRTLFVAQRAETQQTEVEGVVRGGAAARRGTTFGDLLVSSLPWALLAFGVWCFLAAQGAAPHQPALPAASGVDMGVVGMSQESGEWL